jgi:hypothetical protein
VARACVEVPALNGFWTDRGFVAGPGVHIGCAIALRGGGLVAPALHDVDRKPLDLLAGEFGDLVKRARAGGLRSSEMRDATITSPTLEISVSTRPSPSSTLRRWPSSASGGSWSGLGWSIDESSQGQWRP